MKTLYCNGVSDVQVSNENKKTSKRIGIASMGNVFAAKLKGTIREFRMTNGSIAGVSEQVWNDFMEIHNTQQVIEKVQLDSMPLSAMR